MMSKEVVGAWNPQTLEEMRAVLLLVEEFAQSEGHHPSTVYPNKLRVTLVRETLTDGSYVMNVNFFDGERV